MSLPDASYCTETGELTAASRIVTAYFDGELDLHQLTRIHSWLWVTGLATPLRSLHQQLLLGWEIFATERMDMNLSPDDRPGVPHAYPPLPFGTRVLSRTSLLHTKLRLLF
ncbi:hypothetical protein QQS21_012295 [Conoideocrella luteorostrata]|uniref:Uncharacterized protein n=1 Tax=Conoideocrella luteorostrata TaxID=1105319 RepID=A0AAJ0CEB0_9HYPO|nr:hypothetical protein QQS21_012295 [Conoideocrella luteorostrata]